MKERWPRATPVTRTNHGTDNDRMEAHASLAGMGDFNCRAEIDLSLRGDLSCVRTIFHSLFPTSLRSPLSHPLSPQCSKRECVFTLRKHLSLLCHVALKATEIEYEIQRVSEILRYAFMPRLNFLFSPGGMFAVLYFIRWILKITRRRNKLCSRYLSIKFSDHVKSIRLFVLRNSFHF